MKTAKSSRTYDVIVFGATSFVGQILCRYLVKEFGTASHPGARKLNWAIAGRSKAKLDTLIAELGVAASTLSVIIADAADEKALAAMCAKARVVVSTVGPYALYGEPLVRACAESGTDYCDLTGEAQWVRRMIATYGEKAKATGARLVHCCGFDSIPSDLGVWYLQQQSLKHYGELCTRVAMRVKAMRGAASGGTVASMVNIVVEARRNPALRRELSNPYSLCVEAAAANAVPKTRQENLKGAKYDSDFGVWTAPFVMAAINSRVVFRSHALAGFPAGDKFQYDEAMMMGRGFSGRSRAIAFSAGLAAFLVGAAIGPTRYLLEKFALPAPGEGPSPTAQARGFFDFRLTGKTADGRDLKVKVTGDRDPGYGSTGKMLGEAAACLAFDVPELAGGFWTPATALAAPLHQRLIDHAGLTFSVLED
jgi:short subunit dehydrogenase-like uncharacterized protein